MGCLKMFAQIPVGAHRASDSCGRLAQASYGVACDGGDYWENNASWKKLLRFVVLSYLHRVAETMYSLRNR